jgi:hypothetical protein
MKVKIDDKFYDSTEVPIVVSLTESEKNIIKLMKDGQFRITGAPETAFEDQEAFEEFVLEGTDFDIEPTPEDKEGKDNVLD